MVQRISAALILAVCASGAQAQVRVLTMNIALDAKDGRVPAITELIRKSSADVVNLQEAESSGEKIASSLEFHYLKEGDDTAVLSRFEIAGRAPGRHGVFILVPNVGRIAVFNLHLFYKPYQPYQLLNIPYEGEPSLKTAEEAVESARKTRGGEVSDVLNEVTDLPDKRMIVLLTGDFNEPSYLDWTAAAAKAGRHPSKVVWPATKAFADAGFVDVYRELYPDEMARAGNTWTPTTAADDPKDHHDRIDFIFRRGGLKTAAVDVIGENSPESTIVFEPYPSDHRAVLASFTLPPVK